MSTLDVKAMRRRLDAFDINCNCKCLLIVSCALGESGCRQRRREGNCGCAPSWLPTCILEPHTPHGCDQWREGKTCGCPLLQMPRCLIAGCHDRKDGKRCECPRTPLELCKHVLALIDRFADLTSEQAAIYLEQWARLQRRLYPHKYEDRPLPDEAFDTKSRAETIALMQLRFDAGCSLWHPDEIDARRRRSSQISSQSQRTCGTMQGFFRLLTKIKNKSKGDGQ